MICSCDIINVGGCMFKKYTNYLLHALIYFFSFAINYIFFIIFMLFVKDKIIGIQIINLIAWILSMLFIFFVDKMFVPDLVNENNSRELVKFILLRVLSLIIEVLIIFIFVTVFQFNYVYIKLISLILLFCFNHFYVKNFKYS